MQWLDFNLIELLGETDAKWTVSSISLAEINEVEEEAAWKKGNPMFTIYTLERIWRRGSTLYDIRYNEAIEYPKVNVLGSFIKEVLSHQCQLLEPDGEESNVEF